MADRQPAHEFCMKKNDARIKTILDEAVQQLQCAGIEQPRLAAEILIAAAVNCPRLELYLRFDEKLTPHQLDNIQKGIKRLTAHEPIQYVLGQTEFMGHSFKCDRRALIPRPETEEMTDWIIGYEPLWQIDCPAVVDIGTGSGCIIISLALSGRKGHFWAVDISPEAIELARENARMHNVLSSISFITAGIADGKIPCGMDAVIANPPYVRSADYHGLAGNIRFWEPRLALDGGDNGLHVIHPIITQAFRILKPNRCLFLEIGAGQGPAVRSLLTQTGFSQSLLRRDQAGHDRLILAIK